MALNWFNVIKNPKLRAGSKVITNLGSSSDNESDGPCKKKILEYREKLKNMDGIMTDLDKGYKEKRLGHVVGLDGRVIEEEITLYINGVYPEFAEETKFSLLPEEVACKAIKMFSEAVPQQYGKTIVRDEIGGHLCEVRKKMTEYLGKVYFEIALVISIKTAPNTGGLTVVNLTHRINLPSDMSKESRKYITRRYKFGVSSLLEKMDWGRT